MSIKILIADDEPRWRRIVSDFLKNEGFAVVEAADGQEAVTALQADHSIDLAILDVMMPGVTGIEACRRIRTFSSLPIMMVTARDDDETELNGFQCGADEYISKPLKFPIFIARVQALLKRSAAPTDVVSVSGIDINTVGREVRVGADTIALTPKEYELLLYFAQNRNIALSRQQILSAVWQFDYFGDLRTVDTHVKNLRMKLGSAGDCIRTVRGRGYKLEG